MTFSLEARGIELWIKFIIRYRYIIHILFGIGVYVDFLMVEVTLTGVYILYMVLSGVAFTSKWIFIMLSGMAATIRDYLSTTGFPNIEVFIFQWFTFFSIIFIISTLLKNRIEDKNNQIDLIKALAQSLDSRDSYTAFHSQNVALYSEMIAKEMGLSYKLCNALYLGGLLHDIGKIGVPEGILNKPGRLTAEEFSEIKKHPVTGYEMVKHIPAFRKNGILDMILHHHERYDGKGYPRGLKAEEIPLVARIMAVADAFDAMTSKRIYRNEVNLNYTINEIRQNIGTQFDPKIARVFLNILETKRENILLKK
jgi:putative nucleotidyltransferase with HDIG domain